MYHPRPYFSLTEKGHLLGVHPGSYLQRDHLHEDGEVGEVSAAADGVAQGPLREDTALV